MRTLASTFSTRDEAATVCRRLEAIGIPADRIVRKDVAEAAGGVFISVKVTTEQVEPVSEIFREGAGARNAAEPAAMSSSPQVAQAAKAAPRQADLPPRPLPRAAGDREPIGPRGELQREHGDVRPPPDRSASARPDNQDWTRIGRYVIFACLVILAAFILGAMVGLVV